MLQLADVSVALETALVALKVFCELCGTQIFSQAFPERLEEVGLELRDDTPFCEVSGSSYWRMRHLI